MIKVFIGYDPRETVAFNVLAHSIHEFASEPVSITPVRLSALGKIYRRDRYALQSTDFSFSRFLTPYLCDYEGFAIFMDCDMLFRDDIAKLWALRDSAHAVQVVKHHHVPKESVKFLNAPQTRYDCKNWSSVMLFNNVRCRALTPDYVNTASGLELHQFKWLSSLDDIGELPHEWNHLVGYDEYDPQAKNVHFTIGGPYFNEFRDCEYAREWFAMRDAVLHVSQRNEMMAG